MEHLFQKSERKVKQTASVHFKRYLYELIDWNQRLLVILGHRGTGKTTMLLQRLVEVDGIYISLDDYYFETNRLIVTVEKLYEKGYRNIFLDEVHKYANWSKDLKQIYDDFPDLKIIATGSSILDLKKGNSDLSRRAVIYKLYGLSFREFLQIELKTTIDALTIDDIIENHTTISTTLNDKIEVKKLFERYLKYGYYPFYLEGKSVYYSKLQETINLVIETDIAPFEELNYSTIRTLKKLLYVISQLVPFTPNISKLSEKLGAQRNTVLKLLDLMDHAHLLNLLKTNTDGISFLQKPEKIFLENTNLMYLFEQEKVNVGNLRETFFFNQVSVKHQVSHPKYGDFLVDNKYIFEIGGANKTREQISGLPNAYLAIDIENGSGSRIPLWLFGFLY